jgi:hypothetical protein
MPLPIPNKQEEQSKFVSRCMTDDIMKSEYSDDKQRAAVCYSQYKSRKKTAKGSVEWCNCRKGDALGLI